MSRDAKAVELGSAARVHRIEFLKPPGDEPHAEVIISGDGRTGRFGDVERVAHVVAMAVGEHDMGNTLDGGFPIRDESRVPGEERIDQHGTAGKVETEGGMSEPGDLHGDAAW